MPSRNTIEIVVQGEDKASAVLNKVSGTLTTIGKVGFAAIVTGATAASAAVTAFAASSLNEFIKYEKGISEVFTLIPNASAEMRKKLEDDITSINSRFGFLNEQTIPAMYQSLSAGVPPENVLSFLEIASKAAIGGVTDLETAVDGISSVVNAYGSDVIDAGRASDIFFTAVRLGKTTFGELSASVFQIAPLMSALNVKFEEGAAAVAALSAQGVPTSVAMTQIRQLLVELQKPTTEAAQLFEQMAGKSFPQFIKEGGNMAAALGLIEQGAKQSGKDLSEVFGSVEALNAFLGLTGTNMERYVGFLTEMGNSAGATDKAFEEMSKTMSFQLSRLTAKFQVLRTEVGRKLAPHLVRPVEMASEALSVFIELVKGGFSGLSSGDFGKFGNFVKDMLLDLNGMIIRVTMIGRKIKSVVQNDIIGSFKRGFGQGGLDFFEDLGFGLDAVFSNFGVKDFQVSMALEKALFVPLRKILKPSGRLFNEASKLFSNLFSNIDLSNVDFGSILSTIFKVTSFATPLGAIKTILMEVFDINIIDIIGGIIDGITRFLQLINLGIDPLQALGITIQETLGQQAFDVFWKIIGVIDQFINQTLIPGFNTAVDFIKNTVIPTLQNLANWFLNDALPAVVSFIQNTVLPIVNQFIGALSTIWDAVRPALEAVGNWFLSDILPRVIDFVTNTVLPSIQTFINTLSEMWTNISPTLTTFANWFLTDIMPQIVAILRDSVLPAITDVIDILITIWEAIRPGLESLANWFLVDALPFVVDFLANVVMVQIQQLIDILAGLWSAVQPHLEAFKNNLKVIFDFVGTYIIQPVIDLINRIPAIIEQVKNEVIRIANEIVNFINTNIIAPLQSIGVQVTTLQPVGAANGMEFVPRNMPVYLHRGEGVLTRDENEARLNGANNQTNNISINLSGNYRNQSEANADMDKLVSALRLKGIDLSRA